MSTRMIPVDTQANSNSVSGSRTIRTTCAYCGVGCGIEATVEDATSTVHVSGDERHPSSQGKLCSKGASLGETLSLDSRLLHPEIDGERVTWDEAIGTVAETFRNIVAEHGPDAVAFYGSGQLLTEDYYVANKLMKGFIGSANIDTNSRLCMSSAVAGHKRAFGSDTVPNCYEDLDQTDLVVLVGSNTAWCHPIIYQRIRQAKARRPDMRVVLIDPRKTATADIADLHLPLAATTDVVLFNGLFRHLADSQALNEEFISSCTHGFDEAFRCASEDAPDPDEVARLCELDAADVRKFYDWFADTPKTMTLYSQGVKQSSSGVDKVNAILNCHLITGRIGLPGAGPLSLTGQPNAMGGREVGGLANQLAAHMDLSSESDRDRVKRFWEAPAMAEKPGYAAVELFKAIERGEVKAVWIMATNPVVSLPNADQVKRALEKCDFVVVSDCVARSDTLSLAKVKLPAQGWSEKDGMVTNSERYISHQRALLPPAGEAKADWWIISRVGQAMGFHQAFSYQHPVEIFREHAALSGFENHPDIAERDFDISAFADISMHDYEHFQPIQWPVNEAFPQGRQRFFHNGYFYTPDRKARLVPVRWRRPEQLPDDAYPLILNTGRLRDQWHTMTRSALSPRLNQHRPEPFVEVHPNDAGNCHLKDGHIARITSRWGEMYARIKVTDSQKAGNVFVPMHWSEQYARKGRMGAVVNPFVDPVSGQPESKHTPVTLAPFHASWYGVCFSRQDGMDFQCEYQVKINAGQYQRYELAGLETGPDSLKTIEDRFGDAFAGLDTQSYEDSAQGVLRIAKLSGDGVQAVLMLARSPLEQVLPNRSIVSQLFEKESLTNDERMTLLSGLPAPGSVDEGPTVCACFNVGEYRIRNEIAKRGLDNYKDVGRACQAGTNCGSCVPEIKVLVTDVLAKRTEQIPA